MVRDDSAILFSGQRLFLQYTNSSSLTKPQIIELVFKTTDGSVNVLDTLALQELEQVIILLNSLDNNRCQLLLLRSAIAGFIAGADVKQFSSIFAQGESLILQQLAQCHQLFDDFSQLPFPTIAWHHH